MKIILSLIILTWSWAGWAADGGSMPVNQQTPKKAPQIISKPEGYFLDFGDGRVAGMFQEIGKVERTFIGLRQIENTCDYEQVLTTCKYELDIAVQDLSVRWVYHPDQNKIGSIVTTSQNIGNSPKDTPIEQKRGILTWYDAKRENFYSNRLKKDRLVCAKMDWAKNLTLINGHYIINSWANESMLGNSITGMNENQSVGVVFDVQLKKVNEKTFEVAAVGREGGVFDTPNPFLASQVATLNFLDKDNRSCMVSFEASVDAAISVFRKEGFDVVDPQTRGPLRRGSSIKNSLLGFYITQLLNNSAEAK